MSRSHSLNLGFSLEMCKQAITGPRFPCAQVLALPIVIVAISCHALVVESIAGGALPPVVGELLDETVQLAQSASGVEQARILVRIAAAHQKIGSVTIARSLLKQATNAVGQFDDAESWRQIQVLRELISVERQSDNREALVETAALAVRFIGKQAAARSAKNPAEAEFIRLDELLNLADIHAAVGDTGKAKAVLQEIISALPQLKWEQQGLIRQGLARGQAQVGDDAGAHATLSENEAYFIKFSRAYNRPLVPYLHEVSSFGFVAREQFLAGRRQAAQETLKKAYSKAKTIPFMSDGQSDDGPRSAALRSVVMIAAEIDMTSLAVEAQHGITDTAYHGALSLVIRALARNGDSGLAHKLAAQNKCCNELLALGLAEHGDWASSVRADESQGGGAGRWEWDHNYFKEVAKARFLALGMNEALTWARHTPKKIDEAILALLGVAEGVAVKKSLSQSKEEGQGQRKGSGCVGARTRKG